MHSWTHKLTHRGQPLVCMLPHYTHTLTHTSESSKSESPLYSVSHNSLRQCIIKVLPPKPLHSSSSHFHPPSSFLPSASIYLLSSSLPVTQQLGPANPFWKETTEQKITSPPLSHTPSFPFVFSSGLPLTPPPMLSPQGAVSLLHPSTLFISVLLSVQF